MCSHECEHGTPSACATTLPGEREHVFFAFGPGEGICRQPGGKVKNVSIVFHEAT